MNLAGSYLRKHHVTWEWWGGVNLLVPSYLGGIYLHSVSSTSKHTFSCLCLHLINSQYSIFILETLPTLSSSWTKIFLAPVLLFLYLGMFNVFLC